MRDTLPRFVDIDGTLTDTKEKGGKTLATRMNTVRKWIRDGHPIVIWSANGTAYAKSFCRRNALNPLAAIGKPSACYDDNATLRPDGLRVLPPSELE